jgi:serine/threonine protein kinase
MELVHGVPITKFCDAARAARPVRPVCQAIQHAHQKGIIYRDVKPFNVLVTMYDDKPVPKVIDFGVAKAIEQRLTEKTMFTQFGALVGTFEYMSPEQAEMNAFGVDTRSDIYSLGVLLYGLPTGTTPLERERLPMQFYRYPGLLRDYFQRKKLLPLYCPRPNLTASEMSLPLSLGYRSDHRRERRWVHA